MPVMVGDADQRMSGAWFASDAYPEIRGTLAEELQDLAPEQIEEIFAHLGAPADVVEDFLSDIGRGISRALPYATQALPGMIQGAASGASLGVPGMIAGAAMGGIGSLSGPAPVTRPSAPSAPGPAVTVPSITPPAGADGSSSAAQLLLLLANPEVVRALMALALGPAGRQTLTIGGRNVPVTEIAGMLSVLSGAAASTSSRPAAAAQPAEDSEEDEVPAAVDVEARNRADLIAELLHQEALATLPPRAWPESWDLSEAEYEESDEPYYESVYA
jgi:hypothetical protein